MQEESGLQTFNSDNVRLFHVPGTSTFLPDFRFGEAISDCLYGTRTHQPTTGMTAQLGRSYGS